MKYKSFRISAFEHKPGKWRAQITRVNGRRLKPTENLDHSSAVEATIKAMQMVDAVSLSHNIERTTERHWRCLSKAGRD
jgi:hypothetical protein